MKKALLKLFTLACCVALQSGVFVSISGAEDLSSQFASKKNLPENTKLKKEILFEFAKYKNLGERTSINDYNNLVRNGNTSVSTMLEEEKVSAIIDCINENASSLPLESRLTLATILDRIVHGLDRVSFTDGLYAMLSYIHGGNADENLYELGFQYNKSFILQEMLYNSAEWNNCWSVEQNYKDAVKKLSNYLQIDNDYLNGILDKEIKADVLEYFKGDEENPVGVYETLIYNIEQNVLDKYFNDPASKESVNPNSFDDGFSKSPMGTKTIKNLLLTELIDDLSYDTKGTKLGTENTALRAKNTKLRSELFNSLNIKQKEEMKLHVEINGKRTKEVEQEYEFFEIPDDYFTPNEIKSRQKALQKTLYDFITDHLERVTDLWELAGDFHEELFELKSDMYSFQKQFAKNSNDNSILNDINYRIHALMSGARFGFLDIEHAMFRITNVFKADRRNRSKNYINADFDYAGFYEHICGNIFDENYFRSKEFTEKFSESMKRMLPQSFNSNKRKYASEIDIWGISQDPNKDKGFFRDQAEKREELFELYENRGDNTGKSNAKYGDLDEKYNVEVLKKGLLTSKDDGLVTVKVPNTPRMHQFNKFSKAELNNLQLENFASPSEVYSTLVRVVSEKNYLDDVKKAFGEDLHWKRDEMLQQIIDVSGQDGGCKVGDFDYVYHMDKYMKKKKGKK